jgi:V/A-type H+-transporting ATPase subunit C
MNISIARYSSVNAKVKALYGKLLTKYDYEELLSSRTVRDIAGYLKKNTGYSSVLSNVEEYLIHRSELEMLLKTSLLDNYVKIMLFLKGNTGKFLKAAFLRYELEDLKLLFRIIYTDRESEAIVNSLVFLKNYSNLDFVRLVGSKNISEMIAGLRESQYYKVLSPFLNSTQQPNLFDIEMALDLHYFMNILKLKDRLLTGFDRKSITHSFGTEIDIMNLFMLYRCKMLFRIPDELIFKYIIPHWYRLSRGQLINLSQTSEMDEYKRLLLQTKYARIFEPNKEHLWERNSMTYMHNLYKRQFRKDCYNLGGAMAYLHLKEMDIKNIITLIEGVRYSLPKEKLRSYLVGINKRGD